MRKREQMQKVEEIETKETSTKSKMCAIKHVLIANCLTLLATITFLHDIMHRRNE